MEIEENDNELKKRKKIRKLLLISVNNELKEIVKNNPTFRINSRTVEEINKIYNQYDILLHEKSTIYTNYIKTEETMITKSTFISKNISPKTISKSENKVKKTQKSKKKSMRKSTNRYENRISQIEINSPNEDTPSPMISFLPKKIELGQQKLINNKKKLRNNQSINILPEKLNSENLNKSTKLGGNHHLLKLIEKITIIKNNENTENIIKANIKKLRNYCYKLRKRRKRMPKNSLTIKEIHPKKSKEYDKPLKEIVRKRNSITHDKLMNDKLLSNIRQKIEEEKTLNMTNNMTNRINEENNPTCPFSRSPIDMKKKPNNFLKLNQNKLSISYVSSKNNSKFFGTNKDKDRKNSYNESAGKKYIVKLHKKKNKKQAKAYLNEKTEEVPYLNLIGKESMKSTISKNPLHLEDFDSNKNKYNKFGMNKKKKEIDNKGLKVFKSINIFNKKDKIELHDNLFKIKSNKKIKRNLLELKNEKNNGENRQVKKLSIALEGKKKLKRKYIESPTRKIHRCSNLTNYNNVEDKLHNPAFNDKSNKNSTKKNKKYKEINN